MTQQPQRETGASRRGLLAGVGLVGLAGAASACSAGSSSSSGSSPAGTSAAAGTTAGAGTNGSALASTSEIPVGGGKIFTSEKVVVTQPSSGEFKAFSAVCTHMGCLVNSISDGTIDCPCHGSQYSIKTGAVVAGPAPRPLPPEAIKVTGTSIYLG